MLAGMHPDAPARRITTWLAILGYTLVASGLPLPLGIRGAPAVRDTDAARRLAAKDRSRPFPCMDRPCGCDTADRCFTSCCCHTPAETLAWAKSHGVEPALLVALERRVNGDPPVGMRGGVAAAATTPSCCVAAASRVAPSCCSTEPTAATVEHPPAADACSDRQSPAAPPRATSEDSVALENEAPADDEPVQQPRSRTVTLRAMLACGGIVAEWFVAGAALPPPKVEISLVMRVLEATAPADDTGECLRAAPAAPPPRAA